MPSSPNSITNVQSKPKSKFDYSFTDLDMKGSATKLRATLVVKLHPSTALVKASTFPLEGAVLGRGCSHESGQKVHGAVERVEDWP